MAKGQSSEIKGVHAILGIDIVSFSTLSDEDQIQAIRKFLEIVNQALLGEGIKDECYRWSPAGDGGFLTFQTSDACIKALDVAFSIWDKFEHPKWTPIAGEKLRLRIAINAGLVEEGSELGRSTNIWGDGINKAARILSICATSQILLSDEYHKTYIKGRREGQGFEFGEVYHRTVKHGVDVSVMNVSRKGSGINETRAKALRWERIGSIWSSARESYEFVIRDAMNSGDPVAALAAAKFLCNLDPESPASQKLFSVIGKGEALELGYRNQRHPIFSTLPSDVLKKLIQHSVPLFFSRNDLICNEGDVAKSCYFPIYGTVRVEGANIAQPLLIPPGEILGEFSIWIPNLRRTATLKAVDDSLILEVSTSLFQSVIDDYPNLAKGIYGTIQQRLLENVTNSEELFPEISIEWRQDLAKKPSACEKYLAGAKLDISINTYVLFNGKVRIQPSQDKVLEITANGHFGPETIVGVVADQEPLDGSEAEVLEDSVAVHLPRETLIILQNQFPPIARAWDRIWGERFGQIRRSR